MTKKLLTYALCWGILSFGFHHVLKPTAKGIKSGAKTAYRVIV